jgi:hypothetical protein
MVAEFSPLVDFSSLRRSGAGTSFTDRYTASVSPIEIRMVELFITPDLPAACAAPQ